ncbi:MAG: hypothetical protein WCV88_00745 [Patescibacteria group bacterium]|jgi:hypothetical protein
MEEIDTTQFIKGVERLVKPTDVVAISFLNSFTKLIPKPIQKKLMTSTAKTIPHMGFVVEPYSLFLCYKLKNVALAQSLISADYEMIKTKIFADDEPEYYIIFGCVTAHTSAFWGSRIEMYVIAENKHTGLLSWVIVDYDTNTNSYDPKHGLVNANSTNSVMTTTHHGKVLVHMERDDASRKLVVEADSTAGTMWPLDQRLWLEGNLSIDYGTNVSDGKSNVFSLQFDPLEVEQALRIPLEHVTVETNSWYPGLFEPQPIQVVCFPYAQHFVTDSYVSKSTILTKDELVANVKELDDLSQFSGFSAKPIKRQLFIGMMVSATITTALVLYIIVQAVNN